MKLRTNEQEITWFSTKVHTFPSYAAFTWNKQFYIFPFLIPETNVRLTLHTRNKICNKWHYIRCSICLTVSTLRFQNYN